MTKIKKIAVGETEWKVWVLDDTGHVWSLAASNTKGGLAWVQETVGKEISELAVDGAGNLWTVNKKGVVHIRHASQGTAAAGKWEERPPRAGETALGIAAGKSEIMMVNNTSHLRRWDGSKWADYDGDHVAGVCSGGKGVAYCINSSGKIYKSKDGKWAQPEVKTLKGVKRLEVGFDNAVMYLASDGHVTHLATGTRDAKGAGVDLGVSSVKDVWVVNDLGEIWRRTVKPIAANKLVLKTDTSYIDGTMYTWSQIRGPGQ